MAFAVSALTARGVSVVAAASNDGSLTMGAPACLSNVIAVGATYDNPNLATFDTYAAFSSINSLTDVAAPGASVEGVTVGGNGGFLPSVLREEGVYDPASVAALLQSVRGKHPDESRVTVAAESGVPYEEVVEVMDLCRTEGFADIALCALHDRPEAAGETR